MTAKIPSSDAKNAKSRVALAAYNQLLVRGYWHWDGVRYAWVGDRAEPLAPDYVWR